MEAGENTPPEQTPQNPLTSAEDSLSFELVKPKLKRTEVADYENNSQFAPQLHYGSSVHERQNLDSSDKSRPPPGWNSVIVNSSCSYSEDPTNQLIGEAGTGEPSGIFNDPVSVSRERNVDELIQLSLEEQTDRIINFSGVLNTTDEILDSAVNQSATLGTF